ncbi:hypothetical protein FA13DRAFT_1715926 [Coprinellus micaceus]|uniref:Uncharacterized protein n=1 Tax=Coprinellus micaceus TaxID=71717 RepID=A0A4Y7SL91_COPMI|nr:hypothetical protein FA13DRAFT_1715926 [Coprinellus micaceus]
MILSGAPILYLFVAASLDEPRLQWRGPDIETAMRRSADTDTLQASSFNWADRTALGSPGEMKGGTSGRYDDKEKVASRHNLGLTTASRARKKRYETLSTWRAEVSRAQPKASEQTQQAGSMAIAIGSTEHPRTGGIKDFEKADTFSQLKTWDESCGRRQCAKESILAPVNVLFAIGYVPGSICQGHVYCVDCFVDYVYRACPEGCPSLVAPVTIISSDLHYNTLSLKVETSYPETDNLSISRALQSRQHVQQYYALSSSIIFRGNDILLQKAKHKLSEVYSASECLVQSAEALQQCIADSAITHVDLVDISSQGETLHQTASNLNRKMFTLQIRGVPACDLLPGNRSADRQGNEIRAISNGGPATSLGKRRRTEGLEDHSSSSTPRRRL